MRKYFKYILVFFICGFIFSCTETTSEIKVYSIDGITKIWNKHKNEYIKKYTLYYFTIFGLKIRDAR